MLWKYVSQTSVTRQVSKIYSFIKIMCRKIAQNISVFHTNYASYAVVLFIAYQWPCACAFATLQMADFVIVRWRIWGWKSFFVFPPPPFLGKYWSPAYAENIFLSIYCIYIFASTSVRSKIPVPVMWAFHESEQPKFRHSFAVVAELNSLRLNRNYFWFLIKFDIVGYHGVNLLIPLKGTYFDPCLQLWSTEQL